MRLEEGEREFLPLIFFPGMEGENSLANDVEGKFPFSRDFLSNSYPWEIFG